jgi:hypothetical protein
MVTFVNYANTSNVTGFASAISFASSGMQQATGFDIFGPLTLAFIFIAFYIISAKTGSERALLFSSFMSMITAFIMVSGGILAPQWLILMIIATGAAAYFGGRL